MKPFGCMPSPFAMDVAGTVEAASRVLGFGDLALVLEPEALRDQVIEVLKPGGTCGMVVEQQVELALWHADLQRRST